MPRCDLASSADEVHELLDASGEPFCVVVNDSGVVAGVLDRDSLRQAADDGRDGKARAEDLMESGPSTYRPGVGSGELSDALEQRGEHTALLTTSDGKLFGLFRRRD